MTWKLKDNKILSTPTESKGCTVDEVIDKLRTKYKGKIDDQILVGITYDVLIKHMTEKKISLDEIRRKYSSVSNIDEVINEVLVLAKGK
ncbi:hypothetical protein SUSAZ_10100 [Sulfolobus acidocaldarius SUSAZ]|nr:hypothetical protein SUSAZ_10100 [Sulfolobus acidocaldarius SUSAZ]